jgi:hypothetical protein
MRIDVFGGSTKRSALRFGLGALVFASFAAAAIHPCTAFAADRQSGIQRAPGGDPYIIVSKDIGGDRWAITLNTDDGTVVGNVFPQAGGPPQFVTCDDNGNDTDTQYSFDCSGAGACTAGPCDDSQWSSLGTVMLDKSFFTPPGDTEPPFAVAQHASAAH